MKPKPSRRKLMAALHAEAAKRGMDHDALREEAHAAFGVGSLRELSDEQISHWTQRMRRHHPGIANRRSRQAAGTAGRKGDTGKVLELASGDALNLMRGYAEALGWPRETLDRFIERQLGGRREVRTTADVNKVLDGLRAIHRRSKNG